MYRANTRNILNTLSGIYAYHLLRWFCFQRMAASTKHLYICAVVVCSAEKIQWRHNGRDGIWNPQPHDCLFRRRSKKTSKLRVTGLCAGNSPATGEFPAQMARKAENVSIWWRHHIKVHFHQPFNTNFLIWLFIEWWLCKWPIDTRIYIKV